MVSASKIPKYLLVSFIIIIIIIIIIILLGYYNCRKIYR